MSISFNPIVSAKIAKGVRVRANLRTGNASTSIRLFGLCLTIPIIKNSRRKK